MTPDSPTLLTIDLDAIAANYRLLAERSAPARTAAAVKADAYGLGFAPVARALWHAGCRIFFVATAEEGVVLRESLDGAEICVLNGLIAGPAALFRDHRLIPVLNDLGQIADWQAFCRDSGRLPAAVHVDTGMSRLGLPPVEFDILATEPDRLDGIECRYLISHLACAEDVENPMNATQRDAFAEVVSRLPGPVASLANSAGIFLGPGWHFSLTRPGAALYGIAPQSGRPNPMKPVVRLDAKILQIRDVDTPRTVGYGAAHRVTGPTRVATVGVGYADGYLRSMSGSGDLSGGDDLNLSGGDELSGGGQAWIGNIAVPVIGRVSMDLITLDVTRAPEARPGIMVELIGPHHDVDALAREAGTIGYEILTSLGRRYRRHYSGGVDA